MDQWRRFQWEITFALQNGQKAATRADVAYACGCCFRSVACLLQTLFAVNEQYWLNEKGALEEAAGFRLCPPRLRERVESAFAHLSANGLAIEQSLAELEGLARDTADLLT